MDTIMRFDETKMKRECKIMDASFQSHINVKCLHFEYRQLLLCRAH